MFNRRAGFCCNCNSNVLHVRAFERKLTYFLDRVSFSIFGRFGFGPWRCVDCGNRVMILVASKDSARIVSDQANQVDETQAVGNFIKTEQSLAHVATDDSRFSRKFRMSIVEKLLEGKSTVSRACHELDVSELVIQRWIREYLQNEIDKTARLATGNMIPVDRAGFKSPEQLDWAAEDPDGKVIESKAVRKPT